MNIIKMQNLVVKSIHKKDHFKFTGKIKSVTGKSKYQILILNWLKVHRLQAG